MIKSISGKVEIKRNQEILILEAGNRLKVGDILITKSKSSIGVMFDDGSSLALGSNSIFRIKEFLVNPVNKTYDVELDLTKGSAAFESGKIGEQSPESFKFRIPEGTIGVRGTKFLVNVD